jgi:predicted NBD/HSP70 family sugar kinase
VTRGGAGRARHGGGPAGDPEALAVLDELARWVALGLVNLVNLLDPERVVVGGGLAEADRSCWSRSAPLRDLLYIAGAPTAP